MVPMPSMSVRVFEAVRVWPCVVVPLMLTEPVGASLTLRTVLVAVLSTASAVPCPSV